MSQTTQMESAARPCTECEGRGVIVHRDCPHQGNCPCGRYHEATCARCEGSKVEPCGMCGEPSVTRYLGEDLCAECTPPEECRFSGCAICERPIDIREARVPLCSNCEATARVAGQQAADAVRYPDPERAA